MQQEWQDAAHDVATETVTRELCRMNARLLTSSTTVPRDRSITCVTKKIAMGKDPEVMQTFLTLLNDLIRHCRASDE